MSERDLRRAAGAIERVRSLRVRPDQDLAAARAVGELRDRLEREIKQTGGMGQVWGAAAPSELAARTRVVSFSRGQLTVQAPDAATRYRVEQWLRGGGRQILSGCAPATIRRIVVRVGG